MKVWTCLSEYELGAIGKSLGLTFIGFKQVGRAYQFRLGLADRQPRPQRYSRVSHRGRRVAAVCWHGYFHFLRQLFKQDSKARVKTAVEDYNGVDEFITKAVRSGRRNVGPTADPLAYERACECWELPDSEDVIAGALFDKFVVKEYDGEWVNIQTVFSLKAARRIAQERWLKNGDPVAVIGVFSDPNEEWSRYLFYKSSTTDWNRLIAAGGLCQSYAN